MYTGFIYNDVFSKSVNIFGSHWDVTYDHKTMMADKFLELDPKDSYTKTPYPIGLDPVWQVQYSWLHFHLF